MKENEIAIKYENEEISELLNNSEKMYLSVLNDLGLPTENVLSTPKQRIAALKNLPDILKEMPPELLSGSYYLSKFFIAICGGLFDAALNYLWDETIQQMKIRIVNNDLDYFFDVVITNDNQRSKYSTAEHLNRIDDYDLIKGALDTDLISSIGYKHLDYIRYMRNYVSAAHPNQNELNGLTLVSWLEICIKEVIALPPSNVQIIINKLLSNIKAEIIDEEQAETICNFFTQLNNNKADSLAKGLFSIYIQNDTSNQTRANIGLLAPSLWEVISNEVKYDFGIRYANFIANGDNDSKKLTYDFLDLVKGISFIPESIKIPQIEMAIKNLRIAHKGTNNFYNEPMFARELKRIIGENGKLPKELDYRYVSTLVNAFITNGYGVAWNAESIYNELLKQLNARQSFIAMVSFMDADIKSKLQFPLCLDKYKEMLDFIEPNIVNDGVKDLLNEIRKATSQLPELKEDDGLFNKINYFKTRML